MCIFMVPRWKPHTCAHTHTNSHGAAGCLPCTHHEFTHVATDGYCETCMHRKNTDRHTHTKVCLLCECEGMNHTYMHTLILACICDPNNSLSHVHAHTCARRHTCAHGLAPAALPVSFAVLPLPIPHGALELPPCGRFQKRLFIQFLVKK